MKSKFARSFRSNVALIWYQLIQRWFFSFLIAQRYTTFGQQLTFYLKVVSRNVQRNKWLNITMFYGLSAFILGVLNNMYNTAIFTTFIHTLISITFFYVTTLNIADIDSLQLMWININSAQLICIKHLFKILTFCLFFSGNADLALSSHLSI